MTLTPGNRIGPYEVIELLGAGGMGEVYRARDSRLGRDVALKVLSAVGAAEPDRHARFEQEARATAALNHPNVVAVYDVGRHDGVAFLVSELLAGETLRARMAGKRLSVERAVAFAEDVARGLAAAHERGIVHRDIKPENLFVADDGHVKVLDFGVAKLAVPASDALDSSLPTFSTGTGMVVGTPAYMSPEQTQGLAADGRSDIFALGTVLYEMLSGHRPFRADSPLEMLSAIQSADPPPFDPKLRIPRSLQRLVSRCLEKRPEARFQSASDLAFALNATGQDDSSDRANLEPSGASSTTGMRWLIVAAAVATSVALGLYVASSRRVDPLPTSAMTSSVVLPDHTMQYSPASTMALSPDGRLLAYTASVKGSANILRVRSLVTGEDRPLAGTEGGYGPFWSPDNKALGFFVGNGVHRVDVAGGSPVKMADAPNVFGVGAWGPTDEILVSGTPTLDTLRLYHFPASGGTPVPVPMEGAKNGAQHSYAVWLPDGRHFVYVSSGSEKGVMTLNGLYVGGLDGSSPRLLVKGGANAQYANGHLFWMRDQELMAQPFDVAKRELTGVPARVATGVVLGGVSGKVGGFSVARDAPVLVYLPGGPVSLSNLAWYDRAGTLLGVLGGKSNYQHVAISRASGQVAAAILDGAVQSIWFHDPVRGTRARISYPNGATFGAGTSWSPDGQRLTFVVQEGASKWAFYEQERGSLATPRRLLERPYAMFPWNWSSDGETLLFLRADEGNGNADVWAFSRPTGQVKPFLTGPGNQQLPQFSPVADLVAYVSDVSGRYEIYLISTTPGSTSIQVTSDGGAWPRWGPDGRELFYLAPDGSMMSVDIVAKGNSVEMGEHRKLFATDIPGIVDEPFDVAPDGSRFLVITRAEAEKPAMTLVVNWPALIGNTK